MADAAELSGLIDRVVAAVGERLVSSAATAATYDTSPAVVTELCLAFKAFAEGLSALGVGAVPAEPES